MWMLNKSNKLIIPEPRRASQRLSLPLQFYYFPFSLFDTETPSPKNLALLTLSFPLFSLFWYVSYGRAEPTGVRKWSSVLEKRSFPLAELGGSLTKLGVNGGLVASAGFSLSLHSQAGRQAGPSQGNRPQAGNS